MPITYNGTTIGTIRYAMKYDGENYFYNAEIRQGNCLAIIIHVRKLTNEEKKEAGPGANYRHTLCAFYADERHLKNLFNATGDVLFGADIRKIELNMYYKECATLLKYFVKSGHKVGCYYKEPKKK